MNKYNYWQVCEVDDVAKTCTLYGKGEYVTVPLVLFDQAPENTDALHIQILTDEEFDKQFEEEEAEFNKLMSLYDEIDRLRDEIDELES